jgi:hypothetical protein
MTVPAVPIPPVARFVLYLLSAIGTPVVGYLLAKGYIGEAETALWGGLVVIVNAIAASNVTEPYSGEHRA